MKQPRETWIINGTLLTQDRKRSVLRANLRITNGRITAVTRGYPKQGGHKHNVIDAHNLVIMPGFVQAHVHLCQTLFRNQADDMELLDWLSKRIWVMEAAHTEKTLSVSAMLGIYELLSSGTTCILDMGTVRHTDAILNAVQQTGIRANVGKCLMDNPATTPHYLCESTDKAISEAYELYQNWNGKENDRIRVSYAPRFVISCTERLLREIATLAKKQGALVHTHASENLKEIQMVKKLVDCENVEYLHQLGLTSPQLVLAHCIWLKPNEKNIIRKTGTNIVHCPSSNMKLASGLAHIPEMRKRGITVALGADGAPCNNNLNMFNEMRMAALIHKPSAGPKSMKALEVLDMATREGARALNWFDDIGSLEVGKKADIIAVDLNTPINMLSPSAAGNPEAYASSIVYSTSPAQLRWTMVDGKMLYSKQRVLTIDEDKLIKQVKKCSKRKPS
ncbi:MAG: 5'-deoxyadenosine deaminase [Bdellovibrionota bacterium]